MSLLTTAQIQDLASIVLEECGSCQSDDELTDEIALLLEDIAGFETASDEVVRQMINEARSHYHDISKQHEEN
jgi:class 3 adenylate cyclase